MSEKTDKLLAAALAAQKNAYAPYSNFSVGAAVLSREGNLYTGCNVENASYGLTICAERAAIAKMIGAGDTGLAEILVIGDTDGFLPPCGACRQVIAEFADRSAVIYMCNREGQYKKTTVGELIPHTFFLEKKRTRTEK